MDFNAFNAVAARAAKQSLLKDVTPSLNTDGKDKPFNPAEAVGGVVNTIAGSERVASAYMVGKADPHSVVEAIAAAEVAIETAVTVRNRVIEAYQELLRMPI